MQIQTAMEPCEVVFHGKLDFDKASGEIALGGSRDPDCQILTPSDGPGFSVTGKG